MQTRWNPSRKAAAGLLVAMSMCLPAVALAAERSFDRTLTVNGPVTLHVSTGSGYIHVSPGSDNQVHIVGHVKSSNSWWGGSSDDAVSKVASNPPINQAGNIIRVGEGSDDYMRHVSIDYEITTPANTMLTAESGSGDLQLSNLNGTVRAHTGSGSIRADKLGAGSRLETGSGSIEATNLMGSTTLQTGSGEVRAELAISGRRGRRHRLRLHQADQRTGGNQGGNGLRQPRDQRAAYLAMEAGDGFGRHHAAGGRQRSFHAGCGDRLGLD